MNYSALAEHVGLSKKTVILLHQCGFISDPLGSLTMHGMMFLSQIWGNERLLRLQLACMSRRDRIRLIVGAEMTKPQRYVFFRYLKNDPSEGNCLYVRQISDELQMYYNVPQNRQTTEMIKKFRDRARKWKENHPELVKLLISSKSIKETDGDKISRAERERMAYKQIFGELDNDSNNQ
jgi:hypothetical protein